MAGEELEKKTKGDSVWTEGSGVPVPQEPDGGILKPKKVVKKSLGGALLGGGGKNAGFALGILPGLLYRNKYKRDEEEKAGQEAAAAAEAKRAAAQAAAAGAAAPTAGGMKKGGMTASKRADGIASRCKTRGKIC